MMNYECGMMNKMTGTGFSLREIKKKKIQIPEIIIQNETSYKLSAGVKNKIKLILHKIFNKHKKQYDSITVKFVSDSEIRKLNNKFKNKNSTTDVLAFDTGDIAVSIDTAKKQCKDYSNNLNEELVHLSVHGALHLTGMNDNTSAELAEMNRRAEEIIYNYFGRRNV